MDERQLVISAKNGDRQAFCELYSQYKNRLYRYAFYRLGNPDDAEDAVSECVMSAYAQINKLRKPEAFCAWLFKILYYSCGVIINAQQQRRNMLDINVVEPSSSDSIEDVFAKTELEQALGTLKEDEREIVLLSVVSGLNSREIAGITDFTAGAVRSKLSRSLKKMREYLEGE